jgi:hypothetical protein
MNQDLVSILITFVVGLFIGGYLYVTGFVPLISQNSVQEAVDLNSLVINGELYGACGNDCSSFQVLNDGSYSYLYRPAIGEDMVLRRGSLPRSVQRDLSRALNTEELISQSTPTRTTECEAKVYGYDVTYDITFAGEDFILDSCDTAVDENSDLWEALSGIWDYFAELRNNS